MTEHARFDQTKCFLYTGYPQLQRMKLKDDLKLLKYVDQHNAKSFVFLE